MKKYYLINVSLIHVIFSKETLHCGMEVVLVRWYIGNDITKGKKGRLSINVH